MLLAVNWWSLLIRGLVAIALGVVTFIWPTVTLAALVLLFGAYALIDGIGAIAGAVRTGPRREAPLWALILEGIAGIGAGVVTFFWPLITAIVLVYVIAAWALVTGVFEIVGAIRLRRVIRGEVFLLLSGLLSILLGIAFFALPAAGALAIALWLGIYAFIFGVLEVVLAFRLRRWQKAQLAPTLRQPPIAA